MTEEEFAALRPGDMLKLVFSGMYESYWVVNDTIPVPGDAKLMTVILGEMDKYPTSFAVGTRHVIHNGSPIAQRMDKYDP